MLTRIFFYLTLPNIAAAGKETANGGTAAGIEVETTNAAPATADSAQLAPDPTAAARASAQAVSESEDEVVEIKRQHMGGDAEEASDPSRINRLTPGTTDSAVGCKTVEFGKKEWLYYLLKVGSPNLRCI